MSDEDIRNFGYKIERLKNYIDSFNIPNDVHEAKSKIDEMEKQVKDCETELENLEYEVQDSSGLSSKKPLLSKLNQSRTDLDIFKRKLNGIKNEWQNKYNYELLKEGKLSGADKLKTEKDKILEQHRETDIQGDMIAEIGNNIKGANNNLVNINSELKNQGEQIERIHNNALEAQKDVNQADKIINRMQRKQTCMKVIAVIATFVFGIFDVFWLIFWLVRRFK